MKKRFFSLLMVVMLVFSFAPAYVSAAVAGEDMSISVTSDKYSLYAVSVTYTANTDSTPEDAAEVMTVNVGTESYTKELEPLTKDIAKTAVFYVRMNIGENTVTVKGNEKFGIDKVEAESAAVITFEAETDATGGTIDTVKDEESGASADVRRGENPTKIEYNVEYPAGTYNIKLKAGAEYDGKTAALYINGIKKNEITLSVKKWASLEYASLYDVDFGTYEFTEKSNKISFVIQDNLIIDSVTITDSYAMCEVLEDSNSTLKLEAENYIADGSTVDTDYVISKAISAEFLAMEAGKYKMTVMWGNKYDDNSETSITLNNNVIYSGTTGKAWSMAEKSWYFNVVEGINKVDIAFASNVKVDYIQFSPVEDYIGKNTEPLKLEAENMTVVKCWKKTFADDSTQNYMWASEGNASVEICADAGTYLLELRVVSKYGDTAAVTINGDTDNAITVTPKYVSGLDPEAANTTQMDTKQVAVTLADGVNTISVALKNMALDYIVITNKANYSEEKYSYALADANIRTGRRWAMTGSYLGEHDADADEWETTKVNATTKAMSTDNVSHVYYPFTTLIDSKYYVKVTYASKEASKAVMFVDPSLTSEADGETVSNFPQWEYCNYDALGGTKIENGTWQSTYSYSADSFQAPYFTEKYFKVGELAAGTHNFAFVVDPDSTENEGVAIRKVELISADKVDSELYFTDVQMIAENIGENAKTAAIAATPAQANEFSASSALDTDKNTAAVVGYAYNNTSENAEFTFITASYDGYGKLIGVDMSEKQAVAPGTDVNLKCKVSTDGAEAVKVFVWNMENQQPVNDIALFGK